MSIGFVEDKLSPQKHSPRKSKLLRNDYEISSKVKKNLSEIFKVREEVGMRVRFTCTNTNTHTHAHAQTKPH
jgi:hypothetical protein